MAYQDCRKNKRNTKAAAAFEENQERELMRLTRELNSRSYQVGRSVCFVITWPKYREVWAADFRDRIVHHIIYNRIAAQFHASFIQDNYACIPGRGTLFAAQRVHKHLRSATQNWQLPAQFLQADIANFFVSINKAVLSEIISRRIKCVGTMWLINKIIWHDPTVNPICNSPGWLFKKVPWHKSLYHCPADCGLPIGDLSSQLFANIYMNELDQLVKRELKIKWYGRYVDDVILIGHDPQALNAAFAVMQKFAREQLKLEFHPQKTQRNRADKGVDFCGQILLPHRAYTRRRTVSSLRRTAKSEERQTNPTQWASKVNSYIGHCRHTNSYGMRKKLAIETGIAMSKNLTKVVTPRSAK